MSHPLIVPFPGDSLRSLADVGGKAASLIRMCAAGLPVPSGVVITTAFFTPWFDGVKSLAIWTEMIDASPEEREPLFAELKRRALTLPLTESQRGALRAVLQHFEAPDDGMLLAVRSSSPDEDQASASFAGVYETRLGVSPAGLEEAVRACFGSSLDPRVFAYKVEHGFDPWSPRMAVVVQRQVDSEVAGVGFSLNPVTNDYDEAVIDASRGLGTAVVEGTVTSHHFVVNRVTGEVLAETRADEAERVLADADLGELIDLLGRIERLYETPIDVEWARADGRLHVLQARPITTYVPLPPEMVTAPGERRRLYADGALSKGLTMNTPISPLGLDNMESMFRGILESWVGPLERDIPPDEALFFFAGGRMYMNLSNILWLASAGMLAKSAVATDRLMAETLAAIDTRRYRAARRPPWVSFRLLWKVPRALWSLRAFFWNMARSLVAPESAYRTYRHRIDALERDLLEQLDRGLPLEEFRRTYQARLVREIFPIAMPALLAGSIPPDLVLRARRPETRPLAEELTLGATGNVVVEMGLSLHRLAGLLDRSEFDDLDRLAERIEGRRMPEHFLSEWDHFISTFGWRGPGEMDLASPRYADDPRLALRQMSGMVVDDERFDPEATHRRLVEQRRSAYERLRGSVGPLRRALFGRVYRLIERFGGARDTPKHMIVLFNYAIRQRVLARGRQLVREGRLDAAEDVFALTFDELRAGSGDDSLDLRESSREGRRFHEKLDARVSRFPAVIDSRGRILRPPPRGDVPGLLSGTPVSPGVATGPVRILHSADGTGVRKGDVLVAYTTDPGWTPLFVNAAAIVLEVGGTLQHGAVVAREYGKPCVVGIDRVVERLRDGALVEVDGSAGTVRVLC